MTSSTSTSTPHSSCHMEAVTDNISNSAILLSDDLFPTFHASCSIIPAMRPYPCQALKSMTFNNILASILESPAPLNFCWTTWKNTSPNVPNHLLFPCRPHLSEHCSRKSLGKAICTTQSPWLPSSN